MSNSVCCKPGVRGADLLGTPIETSSIMFECSVNFANYTSSKSIAEVVCNIVSQALVHIAHSCDPAEECGTKTAM